MVVYDQLVRGMVSYQDRSNKQTGEILIDSSAKRPSSSSSFRITTTANYSLISPQKKGQQLLLEQKQVKKPTISSTPTISLLTYTQNLYTLSGQQCLPFIRKICRQQLCHVYSLIILGEQIYSNRSDERYMEILRNLVSDGEVFIRMNSHLVGLLEGNRLKVLRKSGVGWMQI